MGETDGNTKSEVKRLVDIIKNSKGFKEELKKAARNGYDMSEEDAQNIVEGCLEKMLEEDWQPILRKYAHSHNDSYPAYTSIITYWGSKRVLEEIVKNAKKRYNVADLLNQFQQSNSFDYDKNFILPGLEVKNAYEVIALAKAGKLNREDILVSISDRMVRDFVARGDVWITHEMADGIYAPWWEKQDRLIAFEQLPSNLQTVEGVKKIYEAQGRYVDDESALRILQKYLTGEKDEVISDYLAARKIAEMFRKYRKREISHSEAVEMWEKYKNNYRTDAPKLELKYLKQTAGIGRIIKTKDENGNEILGNIGHLHLEIAEMYKAAQEYQNKKNENIGNKAIVGLAIGLTLISALSIQTINGNAVFTINGMVPESYLNFGFALITIAAIALLLVTVYSRR